MHANAHLWSYGSYFKFKRICMFWRQVEMDLGFSGQHMQMPTSPAWGLQLLQPSFRFSAGLVYAEDSNSQQFTRITHDFPNRDGSCLNKGCWHNHPLSAHINYFLHLCVNIPCVLCAKALKLLCTRRNRTQFFCCWEILKVFKINGNCK